MIERIDWVDVAMSKYLTGRLADFRTNLEQGAGHQINDLECNAALFFSDLCRLFSLDEQQTQYVLGEAGVRYVTRVLESRMTLRLNGAVQKLAQGRSRPGFDE